MQTIPRTVVVSTIGGGSMDRYGRQLAAALQARAARVREERVDKAGTSAGGFGTPLLSGGTARQLAGDAALLHRLRALPGLPHLAHHHLARYGALLGRPYVVTAHDLIRRDDLLGRELRIARLGARDRAGLRLDLLGIRRAAHVVAPSQATRAELLRELGLPPDRVTVVPEAVDHELFRPVARRLHDGPYLLFVGSEHPRKDLPGLLRALALLAPAHPDLVLVKVGAAGDEEAPFAREGQRVVAELGLARRVRFVGEVPARDLPAWYSGAQALVLASRAEGFGLPPLEAMACGAPVVVSDAGALPEVTGGAALVVPSGSPPALAQAVDRLLRDPALRARLSARGLEHAAAFTWARTARETAAVHERVHEQLQERRHGVDPRLPSARAA